MTYPIECSDELGVEGVKDAADLAQWLNSWMNDADSTECRIFKAKALQDFSPSNYTLAPAQAGG